MVVKFHAWSRGLSFSIGTRGVAVLFTIKDRTSLAIRCLWRVTWTILLMLTVLFDLQSSSPAICLCFRREYPRLWKPPAAQLIVPVPKLKGLVLRKTSDLCSPPADEMPVACIACLHCHTQSYTATDILFALSRMFL